MTAGNSQEHIYILPLLRLTTVRYPQFIHTVPQGPRVYAQQFCRTPGAVDLSFRLCQDLSDMFCFKLCKTEPSIIVFLFTMVLHGREEARDCRETQILSVGNNNCPLHCVFKL